ncbi:hydroxyisourate hydrolase [Halomonas llamarensis]|uniref:5-hydroxyisourate hydrolase n=1 Tax=Halomonas llamarensis TaxID=2945104 RepID=A0ABT0SRD5_9GAMM|nr:hydroxyisourate hydrolase [Halomonas llamarensis]MCL7930387.1 hydroxyisourate hydrolase [Halomonas llamarensis]
MTSRLTRLPLLGAGIVLSSAVATAMAADNPLSVHVLNIQNGQPSPGVEVELERRTDTGWKYLSTETTDNAGRISALYPEDESFEPGVYRVTFETGEWFEARDTATFFPEIPVLFQVENTMQHYHVPMLLSPYGYSTYRGN